MPLDSAIWNIQRTPPFYDGDIQNWRACPSPSFCRDFLYLCQVWRYFFCLAALGTHLWTGYCVVPMNSDVRWFRIFLEVSVRITTATIFGRSVYLNIHIILVVKNHESSRSRNKIILVKKWVGSILTMQCLCQEHQLSLSTFVGWV